jgi:hypothetical protein
MTLPVLVTNVTAAVDPKMPLPGQQELGDPSREVKVVNFLCSVNERAYHRHFLAASFAGRGTQCIETCQEWQQCQR